MDKLALSEVSLRVLRFSSAVSFHQRSTLVTHDMVLPTPNLYMFTDCHCSAWQNCLSSSPHSCTASVTANFLPQSMLHSPSEAASFSSIEGILRIYETRKLTTMFTRSLHLSIS